MPTSPLQPPGKTWRDGAAGAKRRRDIVRRLNGRGLLARGGLLAALLSPLAMPYVVNPESLGFAVIPVWICLGVGLWILVYGSPRKTPLWPYLAPMLLIPALLLDMQDDRTMVFGLAASCYLIFCAGIHTPRPAILPMSRLLILALTIIPAVGVAHLLSGDRSAWTIGRIALTMDPQGYLIGPFPNRNMLADLCVVGWFLAWGLWTRSQSRREGVPLLAAAVFLGACVVATNSRGGLLLWALAHLLALKTDPPRSFRTLTTSSLLAVLLGLLIHSLGPETQTVGDRLIRTYHEGIGARWTIWASALAMWMEHPWLGVGFGRFGSHYLSAQATALGWWPELRHALGATTNAHNVLLHLLAEAGLPGLALWAGITMMLWLAIRSRGPSDARRISAAALLLWVSGHLHITITEPYPLLLFCLLLGIACATRLPESEKRRTHVGIAAAMILLGIVLTPQAIKATRAWMAYPQWIQAKSPDARSSLAHLILDNPLTKPFFVNMVVSTNLEHPERLLPAAREVENAAALVQMPGLLKALTVIDTERNRHERACEWANILKGLDPEDPDWSRIRHRACLQR